MTDLTAREQEAYNLGVAAGRKEAAATLRALLAEALTVLEPFVGAYEAAQQRYRKRGGNPDIISRDAPWLTLAPTLLVGGEPRVAPELRILASPAPYRAARTLAAKLREMG